MRAYAIGDIHGHIDPLRAAHRRIAEDRARTGDADAPVIHLGDMIDRGPDSAGVIALLLAGLRRGEPWQVLKGNHDRYLERFLTVAQMVDPGCAHLDWFDPRLGGNATLASYGVLVDDDPAAVRERAQRKVPADHLEFLLERPKIQVLAGAIFVHAGIRPGTPVPEQAEDDLLWIRKPFLEDPRDHGALVVHGHTAIATATHYGNRLNIDSSMAYGGHLSAVVIENGQAFELTDDGRRALTAEAAPA